MKRRRVTGAILSLVSCLLIPQGVKAAGDGSTSSKNMPVTIAVGVDPAFTPFFVADAEGLFKKYGLNVQVQQYANAGDAADALVARSADVAGVPDFNLLIRAPRAELSAFGIYVEDVGNYVKVAAGKDVSGPKDVKRIGVVPGTFSQYAAARFMQAYHLDQASTKIVTAGPPEMPQLLHRNAMDAFILWEPWPSRAVQQGAKVLMPIREFNLSYVLMLASRREWLQGHQQEAKALMRALSDATAFVNQRPADAAAITKKAAQTPEALTESAIKQLRFGTREITDKDRSNFNEMIDFLVTSKIIPSRPSVDGLVAQGFVPADVK